MDMWSKKWTFVKMKIVLGIILLQVVFVCGISAAADTEDSDLIRESRKLFGGYRITPKFCKPTRSLIKNDPRSHGPTICMFNHECIQRNGVVVGACMDGFLFGTCCQLQGTVENSVLLDNSLESSSPSLLPSSSEKPTNAAAISYENYGGSNFGEQNEINNNDYYVNNVAVQLSNPSSGDFGAQQSTYFPLPSSSTPSVPVTKGEMYLPPSSSSSQYFSPELPSFISTTSHYQQIASSSSTEHMDYITENSLNKITDTLLFGDKLKGPFTHSDITHPEADSVILEAEPETGFYGEAVAVEDSNGYGISSTSKPIKSTFAKPAFKPKPTKPSTEKYVLVHTITNEKQPSEKPSTGSDMESIESIILMLNDTKTGPQYANDPVTENIQDRESTTQTRFPTTSSINYDKYGPTSFYITTKLPASTRRPTTTSITTNTDKKKVPFLATTLAPPTYGYTAISSSLDFQKPKPTNKVTTANQSQKPLVTSYVSSTVIPKRPNQNKGTTRKPIITRRPQPPTTTKVTKKPVTTRQPTRQPPSTIIVSTAQPVKKITPTHSIVASTPTIILVGPPQNKPYHPVLSIIHDNTVQISGGSFTERPHPTVHITPKPTNLPSSTVYSQPTKTTGSYNYSPFITKRPTHSTTALVYNNQQGSTIISDTNSYYGSPIISSTSNYGDEIGDNGYETEYDTKPTLAEETNSNENDLVNFPPVRNPDFNTSNTQNKPINTPVFIEDDKLNNKMNLLVSKIVASLQDNFDELSQIVDESNVTTLRPGVTRRPVQKPSAAGITRRPTTTGRPPQRTTTIKPQRPVAGTTTRRPATTRRPPTRRPVQTTTTKRPVTRITTRKPRPTRKTTTTTTTTAAPEEDEIIQEEEYPEEAGGGGGGGEDYTAPDFDTARLKCGVRPQVKSGRIVGGKSATFGEWPWQVLVRESTWLGLFTKNKCGGVLISKSYVVTAAHCQPGFLANLVAVFGEFDISGEFEKKRAVTKNVKRVIVHRNYDAATFENDLALLELESPIHYDTHIVPICMPSDSADFTGRMATVTGWGRLKYGGGVPSVLQEVQVPIIENSVCQEMFQTAGHNKKILSSFLCAGYANGQRDSCEGDSGGPLVLQRSDGRWELAGTVSHGIKCAAPYLPGVYMRTTFYKPWLESITGVH